MSQELRDRAAVTDLVLRMGWLLDRRDWDAFKALFTERVYTDYTDLWGGRPQEASVDELLATDAQGSWRRTMDGLEATQHLITNVLADLDGDEGVVTANVVGVHRLTNPHGAPPWTLGGTYEIQVVRDAGRGWLIRGITQRITWVDGNQQVLFRAAGSPPAEAATSPPVEAATSPPAEAASSPPAQAASSAPADAAGSPPVEGDERAVA